MGYRICIVMVAAWMIAAGGPCRAQGHTNYVLDDEWQVARPTGGSHLAMWCDGAILQVDDNPSDAPLIRRFGRNGELERIDFTIPGGKHIDIFAVACAADGSLAVGGQALSNDGGGLSFLVKFGGNREQKSVAQLWPYVPRAVTIAPDGSIWTIGCTNDETIPLEINVLKRFGRDLQLRATTNLRARGRLISGDHPARIRDASEHSVLRASKDRIGWLTNAFEYIEFSPDGQETARYPALGCIEQSSLVYIALSERNVAVTRTGNCEAPGYWTLNRQARRWERVGSVAIDPLGWNTPLGFDGDDLIVRADPVLIRRYKRESER
ncbi:MAG TPA: hypothetical protein PKJ41_13445 [Bryobacteraceae bacterium]|nr:hypothetical protein [Bryobacteraceae bacterium]